MPASPRPAVIHDVSQTGCRLELRSGAVEAGGTALLDLPGSGRLTGRVVWIQGNVAGVEFERPLGRTAAIAFGLEQPDPEPEPELVMQPDKSEGFLHHWFRRLTGRFA